MMTAFGKSIKEQEFPLLVEDIKIDYYKALKRRIHHVFKEADRELETLLINFAHSKRCAVLSHCYHLSRYKMRKAVRTLIENDYIELILKPYHNQFATGRARVFQRTPLFEETFKFRLPKRIVVNDLALVKPSIKPIVSKPLASQPISHYWAVIDTNIWHCSKKYQSLINNVKLSLSDGGQVFKEVWLFRSKARLFQHGANNYQSLSGDERKLLLMNNQPTIELDYKSLHPNLLLNRTGNPCPSEDIYERIVQELGLRKSKTRRSAVKLLTLVTHNTDSRQGFSLKANSMVYKKGKRKGNRVMDDIERRPIDVYSAILRAYPALKPYVCTGKYALSLQQEDSKIMIDVLESLAKRCVVGLPVHDSVIVPIQHEKLAKQTMIACYEKHTGFDIKVK